MRKDPARDRYGSDSFECQSIAKDQAETELKTYSLKEH